MIKSEKGHTEIKGTDPRVLADLISVLKAVYTFLLEDHDEIYSEMLIDRAIQMSRMSKEEFLEVLKRKESKYKEKELVMNVPKAFLG